LHEFTPFRFTMHDRPVVTTMSMRRANADLWRFVSCDRIHSHPQYWNTIAAFGGSSLPIRGLENKKG
jgi:hypothetical protein